MGVKRENKLQKMALNDLVEAVRTYLHLVEIPKGYRHRKTTFVFVGDRFKPVSIDCHVVNIKKKGYEGFIKPDATD